MWACPRAACSCRWDLADALVARYANGYKCMGDIDHMIEGDRIVPGYPKEWLVAVGFHNYPATLPPRFHDGHADEDDRGEDRGDRGDQGRAVWAGPHQQSSNGGVAWIRDALRRSLAGLLRRLADRIAPADSPI